jgi:hypothetical protein
MFLLEDVLPLRAGERSTIGASRGTARGIAVLHCANCEVEPTPAGRFGAMSDQRGVQQPAAAYVGGVSTACGSVLICAANRSGCPLSVRACRLLRHPLQRFPLTIESDLSASLARRKCRAV